MSAPGQGSISRFAKLAGASSGSPSREPDDFSGGFSGSTDCMICSHSGVGVRLEIESVYAATYVEGGGKIPILSDEGARHLELSTHLNGVSYDAAGPAILLGAR